MVTSEVLDRAPTTLARSLARRLVDLLWLAVGYAVYAGVRQLHGVDESRAAYERAVDNARTVVEVQRFLQMPSEAALQRPLLDHEGVLIAIGGFYGAAHFLVTFGVLLWLMLWRSYAYAYWRNVLGAVTAVAVGLFALYPTAPPRLLPDGDPERTVDTLATVGGLWSYNSGVLERISDPFAAMPSLHMGWAMWVAVAVYASRRDPHGRGSRRRAVACGVYPVLTFVSVLATGTHWILDAVAGIALVLAVAAVAVVLAGLPGRSEEAASGMASESRAAESRAAEFAAVEFPATTAETLAEESVHTPPPRLH